MKIQKIKIDGYQATCKHCGYRLKGHSETMVQYNMEKHEQTHAKEEKKETKKKKDKLTYYDTDEK